MRLKNLSNDDLRIAFQQAGKELSQARDQLSESISLTNARYSFPPRFRTRQARNASAHWRRLCREMERRGLRQPKKKS